MTGWTPSRSSPGAMQLRTINTTKKRWCDARASGPTSPTTSTTTIAFGGRLWTITGSEARLRRTIHSPPQTDTSATRFPELYGIWGTDSDSLHAAFAIPRGSARDGPRRQSTRGARRARTHLAPRVMMVDSPTALNLWQSKINGLPFNTHRGTRLSVTHTQDDPGKGRRH
jgi:hypothetical protein